MKKKQPTRPSPEGPRRAAWRILLSWGTGGNSLEALRENLFKGTAMDPRDKGLVTELTQGTVRHLLFLDHTIISHLDRPQTALPDPVLAALRLGAYQLIFLHKIPAHAAVKETVQVVKESRYRRFSSLVNAVLRRISQEGPATVPSFSDDPLRHMELATSTPRWLVDRLADSFGMEETRKILQSLNRTPSLTLRVHASRTNRDDLIDSLAAQGLTCRPGKLSGTAVLLEDRAPPWELRPFREGLCTVQDEGAQMIAPLLEPAPGQLILDACAAPGGKTGHLAELTGGRGIIVAADRHHRRVRMMKENLDRLGSRNVHLVTADLSSASSPFAERSFDSILLDAPCSGTGVLRRHPEGKWRKDILTISRITGTQGDLLVSAGRSLRSGGRLLYTTCSLLEEENEEVVDTFLAGSPGVIRVDMRERFPEMAKNLFSKRGDLRLWPHIHGCDGFYACLMIKKK